MEFKLCVVATNKSNALSEMQIFDVKYLARITEKH